MLTLPEKIDDPKIEEKPEEILPPVEPAVVPDEPVEPKISAEDRARALEIELAETRGRLAQSKEQPIREASASTPAEQQYLQTKSVVFGDMGSMDDEDYKKKYGMGKSDVRVHYADYERQMSEQRTAEKMARMEAKNDVLLKHGQGYAKYQVEVDKAIEEASLEVRKDPVRLAKFMERTYLALSRDEKPPEPAPRPTKKAADQPARRIVNDFDAPSPSEREPKSPDENKNDELSGEDLEIGRHFGITTKSELKKYSGRYLEMNFGNGVVFRDPAKGFERISKK